MMLGGNAFRYDDASDIEPEKLAPLADRVGFDSGEIAKT